MYTSLNFLHVKKDAGELFIKPENIIRCEANGAYTILYLRDGSSELYSRNLTFIEKQLASIWFYRVHHSHLINLRHISQYFYGKNSYVKISNGSTLPVSRRKKDGLFAGLSFKDNTFYAFNIKEIGTVDV